MDYMTINEYLRMLCKQEKTDEQIVRDRLRGFASTADVCVIWRRLQKDCQKGAGKGGKASLYHGLGKRETDQIREPIGRLTFQKALKLISGKPS